MGSLVAELAEKLSSATNNFDIDEGTMYVNTSADTVGIGTTNPASKLDVQGTLQVGVNDTGHDVKFFGATAGAYAEWDESADELEIRGGAATPGKLLLSTAETTVVDGNKLGQIDFQAPLDSAGTDAILVGASIYAEADATFSASVNATELVFATGASEAAAEKMRIASNGYVGIGTTAPRTLLDIETSSAASYPLLVAGDIDSDGGYTGISFGLHGNANYQKARIHVEGTSSYVRPDMHFLLDATDDSSNAAIADAKVSFMNDGKVGIGTTAPADNLHVIGTLRINESTTLGHATNAGTAFEIRGDAIASGSTDVDEFKAFKIALNDGTEYGGQAQFSLGRWEENGSDARSSLVISLGHGGIASSTNADVDVMTLRSSGNVGIGTTNPDGLNSSGPSLDLEGVEPQITFLKTGQSQMAIGINGNIGSGSSMVFYTGGSNTRMTITSAGSVGIGTSVPSSFVNLVKEGANCELRLDTFSDTEAHSNYITFSKADGTAGSPGLVDDNSIIGGLSFQAYDGSNYHEAALIKAQINGTPSDGADMPTELLFATTAEGAGSPTTAMTITPNAEVIYDNQPHVVWAGWNASQSTTTTAWVNYPLDTTTIALNTNFMTKSTNTFTCVKAGTYLVSLKTMSEIGDNEYVHHRMLKNGSHYIQTHTYGVDSDNDRWVDYAFTVPVELAATNTIGFDAYMSGGNVMWHDGTSYSMLTITFLHI